MEKISFLPSRFLGWSNDHLIIELIQDRLTGEKKTQNLIACIYIYIFCIHGREPGKLSDSLKLAQAITLNTDL